MAEDCGEIERYIEKKKGLWKERERERDIIDRYRYIDKVDRLKRIFK